MKIETVGQYVASLNSEVRTAVEDCVAFMAQQFPAIKAEAWYKDERRLRRNLARVKHFRVPFHDESRINELRRIARLHVWKAVRQH